MIIFNEEAKIQLIEQMEKRFDAFIELINKDNNEKIKALNEKKRIFFIENKKNIPEVANKIIDSIYQSEIYKVLNPEDLAELLIEEDKLHFNLIKNEKILCRLKAEPNVSDFFNSGVIPKFSCELNSSHEKGFFDYNGKVSYAVYKSIHEDLLNKNIMECLEPIKKFKKYLDFFRFYQNYKIISGIDDINKIDFDNLKENCLKLKVENSIINESEDFYINKDLESNLEKFFNEAFKNAFNMKNNYSLDEILDKSEKIEKTINGFDIKLGTIKYSHALFVNEKNSIRDYIFCFYKDFNEDGNEIELFAFIPYDIELDSIVNLSVFKLKDETQGYDKADYIETEFKLSDFTK